VSFLCLLTSFNSQVFVIFFLSFSHHFSKVTEEFDNPTCSTPSTAGFCTSYNAVFASHLTADRRFEKVHIFELKNFEDHFLISHSLTLTQSRSSRSSLALRSLFSLFSHSSLLFSLFYLAQACSEMLPSRWRSLLSSKLVFSHSSLTILTFSLFSHSFHTSLTLLSLFSLAQTRFEMLLSRCRSLR